MKTHRCAGCELLIDHEPDELCPSCGRCPIHCLEDNHVHMQKVQFRVVGEGESARHVPIYPKELLDA